MPTTSISISEAKQRLGEIADRAIEGEHILGSAKMGPNRSGPGAHIATASFMVAGDARGRGVQSRRNRDGGCGRAQAFVSQAPKRAHKNRWKWQVQNARHGK